MQNYVRAMNMAIEELSRLPLSLRLLKMTHGILMSGVRGEGKTPGEFRRSQNWIGGASIPPHHSDLPDLLSDLEAFWHNEKILVPHLIRIAISHYQFETLHPFLDGNGRIGRLLITLYLVSHGLLNRPSLYLSAHLEKYRGEYYDTLTRVRVSDDLGHWIRFFLQAVVSTAESGKETFQGILVLRREMDQKMETLGRRAENGRKLISHLYRNPAITAKEASDLLGVRYDAANQLIGALAEMGILVESTGYRRNRIFVFRRYLDLFGAQNRI